MTDPFEPRRLDLTFASRAPKGASMNLGKMPSKQEMVLVATSMTIGMKIMAKPRTFPGQEATDR